MPAHSPIPYWMRNPEDQKWILEFFEKSGLIRPGRNGYRMRSQDYILISKEQYDSDVYRFIVFFLALMDCRLEGWSQTVVSPKKTADHLPPSELGL